ncbi:MAG TPA: ribulokinase [Candidatus Aerophobetes bacterium]|uniref:Ribulokinase n=2 Tax=Aerophobetes bacterium TaxID=2030807 RepID=A0A7V0N1A7_UNCAE|nr:ribulokinase [Candidatus Aerophobetes bacterium]
MAKFSIGIDFGTESARAVLVRVKDGEEVANAVHTYADGVIDERLPGTNIELEPDWALQNPADYIEAIKKTIPQVLREAGVDAEDVIGIGIDFTSCTMLPIDKEGIPLCMREKYKDNPHSWVKLWKHHAAQPEADRINQVARERGEKWLDRYGGKISSEWFFPKCLQILNEAPEIYDAADRFIEATDWIILQLTGKEKRNSCTAGYKAIWDPDEGFPSPDYFKAVHPRLENIVDEKMSRDIYPLGQRAGGLTAYMAKLTGLKEGTPVAIGNVDAHVSVPAMTVIEPGKMVMIMGTSICHMMVDKEFHPIPGACGIVKEGILPGYYGYEAGQSAVGDIYAWMVKNSVPPEYWEEAKNKGMNIHKILEEKASRLRPGESGLLALDWWNGNRSVLVDADLSGVLLGYTLDTKPEEIYRAIIEATAFGTYKIINSFEEKGVMIKELYACGGLPERNRLVMQIFSDVTGREIKIAASPHTPAFGSAMFGAVAAGEEMGGYDTIFDAARNMAKIKQESFIPNRENHEVYERIYAEYNRLHDYFGRGENEVMKRLKRIKIEVRGKGV